MGSGVSGQWSVVTGAVFGYALEKQQTYLRWPCVALMFFSIAHLSKVSRATGTLLFLVPVSDLVMHKVLWVGLSLFITDRLSPACPYRP